MGSIPGTVREFSLRQRVQTGSGANPTSFPLGTRLSFTGVKRPRRETDSSLPTSAEFKNTWSYTSAHPCVFMAWCSVFAEWYLVKHRNNLMLPKRFVLCT